MNRGSLLFRTEGGLRLKGEYSVFLNMLVMCGRQEIFYPSSLFSNASLMVMYACRRGNTASTEEEAVTHWFFESMFPAPKPQ